MSTAGKLCKACGWQGVTRAMRRAQVALAIYAVGFFAIALLDAAKAIDLARLMTWPVFITVIGGYIVIPHALQLNDQCPKCDARFGDGT